MSYAKEWEQRCAARRVIEAAPTPVIQYDGPMVEVIIEQPVGPLFMIFKRTVSGRSKALYIGLTLEEAGAKYTLLNNLEAIKREGIKPDSHEIVLFDIVEQGKPEQLSPYFNHRPTLVKVN